MTSDTSPTAQFIGVGLHVQHLPRSVDFYTRVLGMHEIARYALDTFDEVVVGYPTGPDAATILLVQEREHLGPYTIGDAMDRVVVRVGDVHGICASVADQGGTVEREPVEVRKHGVTMAMITDPDGYRLELIQPG